jgi:predicted RNA-binding Zn-ribbon protein involved in translation (DUF1610 family)
MVYQPGGAVPIARGPNGEVVRPWEAEKGVSYTCPGCGERVVLRRGDRRRAHFAHRRGSCAPDSVLHRDAKARIVEVVTEWKAGRGPRPSVSRPCPRYGCDGGIVQDLPDDVTHAESEVRLVSGFIGDVVLFRGSEPAVVIEVFATSAVGREKARGLRLPWVELAAVDVLDRPYWWVALQDGLRPFSCPLCSERRVETSAELREIREQAEDLARRTDIEVSSNRDYHPVPHRCWRCSSEMVVYAWAGGGSYTTKAPPTPIPGSVQRRWTDGAGDYWANCCPYCSVVQGDYHLASGNPEYAQVLERLEELYGRGS